MITLSIDGSFEASNIEKARHSYHLVTFKSACRLQLFAAGARPALTGRLKFWLWIEK
jgi:hypothetical protein